MSIVSQVAKQIAAEDNSVIDSHMNEGALQRNNALGTLSWRERGGFEQAMERQNA